MVPSLRIRESRTIAGTPSYFMKNEAKKGRNNMLLRSTTLRYQWLMLSHFETGVNPDLLLDLKHGAMPVRYLP
jgi:hypothetical protein